MVQEIIKIFLWSIVISGFATLYLIVKHKDTFDSFTLRQRIVGISLFFGLCLLVGISSNDKITESNYDNIEQCADETMTTVRLIQSGKLMDVPNKYLDNSYVRKTNVFRNDTGKQLVKYHVTYSDDGNGDMYMTFINDGEYFMWGSEKYGYYLFQDPPKTITITNTMNSKYQKHSESRTYLNYAN